MKKTLSWFLTLCMAVCLIFPAPDAAASNIASGYCGAERENNISWTLDNTGLLTFKGAGAMKDYDLIRGDAYSYNNQPQVARYTQAPWYQHRDKIVSVLIASGVESVGKNAFYGNPDRPTAPNYRFLLTDITIENGVAGIGENAFARCVSLEELNLPETGLISIGKNAFNGCSSLKSCVIPDSVTEIGDGAFADCGELVLTVGKDSAALRYAVKNNLRHIIAGEDQAYIASGSCGAVQPDDLKWTLDENGVLRFTGTGAMKDYQTVKGESYSSGGNNFYANHTTAPWYEYRDQIKSLEFPDGMTKIGDYAFFGNPRQESAPDYRFGALCQFTMPDSLKEIGDYAFARCEELPGANLPYGVETIGAGAFMDCVGLASVHLPESLRELGASAFGGCAALREIQLPESLTSIGSGAVDAGSGLAIYVYCGSYALQWCQENLIRCKITDANHISVESVDVVPAILTVAVGQTAVLNAVVRPSGARDTSVTWRSLDPKIAAVDNNGAVRGIAPGNVVIMAITSDGQKTAECEVSVTESIRVRGILLDKARMGLEVGQTGILNATILPENASDQSVIWLSSDPNIATVDSGGVVTMRAPGSALISAVAADGGKTSFCEVMTPVPAVGIELDRNAMDLQIGDTGILKATVLPEGATNPNVTWTSRAPAVAEADQNGVITAKQAGEAMILAISQDGAYIAACQVTVHTEMTRVTGVALNRGSVDSLSVGTSVTLTASVMPLDATNQSVSWVSSNPSIAAVSGNGVVTAVQTGTALITAVTADGGYTAECTVTVPSTSAPDALIVRANDDIVIPRGSPLNLPGLIVQAVYGGVTQTVERTSEIMAGGYMISGYRPDQTGKQTLTISYQNLSQTIEITVIDAEILYLNIIRLPDKLTYAVGENLNPDGMILRADYNNGESSEIVFSDGAIPDGVTLTGFQSETTGTRNISAQFEGRSVRYAVTVNADAAQDDNNIEPPRMNLVDIPGGKRVELSAGTGAEIHYTLDGTVPDSSSPRYQAPFKLTETKTVRAVAVTGNRASAFTGAPISVSQVGKITSDQAGTPDNNNNNDARLPSGTAIHLRSETDGAEIFYTTDGSEPTADSPRYGSGILLTNDMTLRAVAVKNGYADSEIFTREYHVYQAAPNERGGATISIGSVASRAGETASVPVYIFTDGAEKITEFSFTIAFERGVFAYSSVSPVEGMPWNNLMVSADPTGRLVTVRYMSGLSGAGSDGAIDGGEMFSLNLRALDSAEDGRYDLNFSDSVMTVKTDIGAPVVNFSPGLITLSGSNNSQLIGSVTFTDANHEEVDSLPADTDGLSATFALNSYEPDGGHDANVIVDVFLAVYDREGCMVDLEAWNVPLTNMASVFMRNIHIPRGVEADTIKIMILSEDMTPMMAANEL